MIIQKPVNKSWERVQPYKWYAYKWLVITKCPANEYVRLHLSIRFTMKTELDGSLRLRDSDMNNRTE